VSEEQADNPVDETVRLHVAPPLLVFRVLFLLATGGEFRMTRDSMGWKEFPVVTPGWKQETPA
jgi:hypothetical protein